MVLGASVFAGNALVNAYPINDPAVGVDDATPAAGGAVVATVTDCIPGETVNFVLIDSTDSAVCSGGPAVASFVRVVVEPTAVGDLEAPLDAGVYEGTATLTESERTLPFSIEVIVEESTTTEATTTTAATTTTEAPATTVAPTTTSIDPNSGAGVPTTLADVLPETGSSSGRIATIAIAMLFAGMALVALGQARKRQVTAS